jgi:hypothetical protein
MTSSSTKDLRKRSLFLSRDETPGTDASLQNIREGIDLMRQSRPSVIMAGAVRHACVDEEKSWASIFTGRKLPRNGHSRD